MKGDRYLDAEDLKVGHTLVGYVHRTGTTVAWTIATVAGWGRLEGDSRNWLTVTDTEGVTHRLSAGSYRTNAAAVSS